MNIFRPLQRKCFLKGEKKKNDELSIRTSLSRQAMPMQIYFTATGPSWLSL